MLARGQMLAALIVGVLTWLGLWIAGFPYPALVGAVAGVFNLVMGSGRVVGETIVQHPQVDGISFTGSVPTARIIGKNAAENIVPFTAELGGKSSQVRRLPALDPKGYLLQPISADHPLRRRAQRGQ